MFYVCHASNTPPLSSAYNLRSSFYKMKVTALKMVTPDISETLDTTHKAMRRHSSEDHGLNICRRDSVNSHVRYSTHFFPIREEFR
jgi:hypothetical protein